MTSKGDTPSPVLRRRPRASVSEMQEHVRALLNADEVDWNQVFLDVSTIESMAVDEREVREAFATLRDDVASWIVSRRQARAVLDAHLGATVEQRIEEAQEHERRRRQIEEILSRAFGAFSAPPEPEMVPVTEDQKKAIAFLAKHGVNPQHALFGDDGLEVECDHADRLCRLKLPEDRWTSTWEGRYFPGAGLDKFLIVNFNSLGGGARAHCTRASPTTDRRVSDEED